MNCYYSTHYWMDGKVQKQQCLSYTPSSRRSPIYRYIPYRHWQKLAPNLFSKWDPDCFSLLSRVWSHLVPPICVARELAHPRSKGRCRCRPLGSLVRVARSSHRAARSMVGLHVARSVCLCVSCWPSFSFFHLFFLLPSFLLVCFPVERPPPLQADTGNLRGHSP